MIFSKDPFKFSEENKLIKNYIFLSQNDVALLRWNLQGETHIYNISRILIIFWLFWGTEK